MRDGVRLKVTNRIFPKWAVAQAWPNTVLVRPGHERDVTLIAHELVHVDQWREHGFFGFGFRYLWELVTKGYTGNHFEHEANEAKYLFKYQHWARNLIALSNMKGKI